MSSTPEEASGDNTPVVACALAQLSTSATSTYVAKIADELIEVFAPEGKTDLILRYAQPLVSLAMMGLLGVEERHAARVEHNARVLLEGGADAGRALARLDAALLQVVQSKESDSSPDLTSWMLYYRGALTADAIAQQARALLLSVLPEATVIIGSRLADYLAGNSTEPVSDVPLAPRTARDLAQVIAGTAMENLLATLADMRLQMPARELLWRRAGEALVPGSLPVAFTPVRFPLDGEVRWLPDPTFTTAPPGRRPLTP